MNAVVIIPVSDNDSNLEMKMSLPIYLDYASTTPVDPIVAETMMEFMTPSGHFGNPASRLSLIHI